MAKNNLAALITSLTKNEKIYFKRWLPNSAKEKDFVLVFSEIEKNPTITTTQLVNKLGKGFNRVKINKLKSHLTDSLLLSLRDYYRKTDLQLEIRSKSDAVEALCRKKLYDFALDKANKLLQECLQIEMFPEALRTMVQIEAIWNNQDTPYNNVTYKWNEFYLEKERIGFQIAESSRIKMFEREMKTINYQLGATSSVSEHRERIIKLSNQINECGISKDACFDARFRYYQLQAFIANFLGNPSEVEKWYLKVLSLLDDNPVITARLYSSYQIIALHNYTHLLLYLEKFSAIPDYLQQMNQLIGKNKLTLERDIYIYGNTALHYYNLIESFEVGFNVWKELQTDLPKKPNPSHQELYLDFMIKGAISSFWTSDYRQSLSITRTLFKEVHQTRLSELLVILKMLEVLCNYELGDSEHTSHLINSYLRKTDDGLEKPIKTEIILFKTIDASLRAKNLGDKDWRSLHGKLEKLENTKDEVTALHGFNVIKYVEGKLTS